MKKLLKVAILAPYNLSLLHPELVVSGHPDGVSCSWVIDLLEPLSCSDIELHVVTRSSKVSFKQTVKKKGITFHIIPRGLPFSDRQFGFIDAGTNYFFAKRQINKVLDSIKPDIVHSFGTENVYSLAGVASKYPCLITIQGIIQEVAKVEYKKQYALLEKNENYVLSHGRYFECRTNFDTDYVKGCNGQAKIFQVHHAVNEVFFTNRWAVNDECDILFVGSLIKRKGVEDLLYAFQSVLKQFPMAELNIVGLGSREYRQNLDLICDQLSIQSHVNFLGYKTSEEIAELQMSSQVFVLPSEIENSPNSIAEAMVTGMPVVATRVGGVPSMIDSNSTGLLIEKNDIHALSESIVLLLSEKKIRVRLGGKAKVVARERHEGSLIAQKTFSAYHQILK